MKESADRAMIEIELTEAFRQEGCPICRLRQQHEAHYLANILWEGVMQVTFRIRFVKSEGLCLAHAWELQALEQTTEQDGLGTGILYESLLKIVRAELAEQQQQIETSPAAWWQPTHWRNRAQKTAADASAPTPEMCPVCATAQSAEETFTHFLADFLQQPNWRAEYQASNGLCLPHLRQVLAEASPETSRWLLSNTEDRLGKLHRDLQEYLRKHAYQYHAEPKLADEQSSWIRAVAFLRGEKPHSREGPNRFLRRAKLDDIDKPVEPERRQESRPEIPTDDRNSDID